MEPWEVAARESIRDLVARYNAAGDSGRFDEMLELFDEDAVLEVPGRELRGRPAIRAFFEEVAAGTGEAGRARLVRHFVATHQIDLESDGLARGRSYYLVLTDAGLDHWGRYVDRYRVRDGRWRFLHRKVTVDAETPGGWSEGSRASAPPGSADAAK